MIKTLYISLIFLIFYSCNIGKIDMNIDKQTNERNKELIKKIEILPKPGLLKSDGGKYQLVKININYLGNGDSVEIISEEGKNLKSILKFGDNSFDFKAFTVKEEKEIIINIKIGKKENTKTVILKPIDKREIHILPYTNVNISRTHSLDEVELIYYENIKKIMDYIEKTSDNPQASQYKWNVDVLWAVECFLNRANIKDKQRFERIVKNGKIGMQALYSNTLPGMSSPEKLYRLIDYSKELEKQFDIKIKSALITDIPGYSAEIIPSLINNGVNYFSVGLNNDNSNDSILIDWDDKPFYWVSQSGEEKLLTWITKNRHDLFQVIDDETISKTREEKLFNYCQTLTDSKYPYEMIQFRYTQKNNAGSPDLNLADFVKNWNKKYISPKLVISTSESMLEKFEKSNKNEIPVYSGEFYPYRKPIYSTTKETILNRKTMEKLLQTDALYTIIKPESYFPDEMNIVWKNILLFDHFTWELHNNNSKQDIALVIQQLNNKKKFAIKAAEFAEFIYDEVLKNEVKDTEFIEVFNTESWHRTDIVKIPNDWNIKGNAILDDNGNIYPLQKLSTGENIFIARNIKGLSSKSFQIKTVKIDNMNVNIVDNQLDNGEMKVSIDDNGNIGSLIWNDIEFINKSESGLNNYNYVKGSDPTNVKKVTEVWISIKENGPVMSSIIVESFPEGCNKMTQEIRLYKELNYVEIINTLNKKAISGKEAVHFGFPFDVKDGKIKLDISRGMINPEKYLLKNTGKKLLTVNKGLDISNSDYGIILSTPDVCLIEIANRLNHLANEHPIFQTIYSYALNNNWHANYKNNQSGIITFRYLLKPHLGSENAQVKRFNIEQTHPLIARKAISINDGNESLFRIKDNNIIISNIRPMDDDHLTIRLFNTSDKTKKLAIQWKKLQPEKVLMKDAEGNMINLPELKQMKPFAILDILVEKIDK